MFGVLKISKHRAIIYAKSIYFFKRKSNVTLSIFKFGIVFYSAEKYNCVIKLKRGTANVLFGSQQRNNRRLSEQKDFEQI